MGYPLKRGDLGDNEGAPVPRGASDVKISYSFSPLRLNNC